MQSHWKGFDGRRRFSASFKREQLGRLARQEVTFAELSRELVVDQSVLRRWKYLAERDGAAAVASTDDMVPAAELKAAQLRVRELASASASARGRKTIGVEIGRTACIPELPPLRTAREEIRKTELLRHVKAITGNRVKPAPMCRVLGIERSSAYRESAPRPARYARAHDGTVTALIRLVICNPVLLRGTARRRAREPRLRRAVNLKRIRRVMELNGWKLPRSARRRTGGAHAELIRREASNKR